MTERTEIKKQSFMTNVSIILFSQIMVKALGMIYRFVITNIQGFGDVGNGFYNTGFQIYTLLLAISSVGVPNAISKMTSERMVLGDYKGAHRIFIAALKLFSLVGIIASATLYLSSDFLAKVVIRMDGAQYTIKALSPSIFFVCVSSVVRGYFSGMQNMKATSYSQMLEQLFKCSLTILFVVVLIGQSPEIMAAGANLATSVATVLSFGYLIIFYKRRQKAVLKKVNSSEIIPDTKTFRTLAKSILMISIPISLGSIITAINRVIDTATITRGISIAYANGIPNFMGAPFITNLEAEAARLAGILSKSDVLINMPLALNIALSTVLVPSVSGALALGKKKEAAGRISYSFLISILLILPCAIGYISLAKPIYALLYPNAKLGADLLQISSVALIFTALNQTISGSLQGMGKVYIPATGLLFGCLVKIILNIILIRRPEINIYGAAISSIACQLVTFLITFAVLTRNLPLKMSFVKYILKPLTAGVVMGIAAYFTHKGIYSVLSSNLLAIIISVITAATIYFILVFIMNIMTRDELEQIPMGHKLCRILQKFKIYRD
jgi:stage V sporulation protein B